MDRKCIYFTGKQQLEVVSEPMPVPGPGQVLAETTRTMISTGTETTVYNRSFEPGSHWDKWAKYPFNAGYLGAGRVVSVGPDVTDWKAGDRIAWRARHQSHQLVPANVLIPIPEGVSDDQAAWMGLAKIVQVGVRGAEHIMGDNVVLIGMGILGQMALQYCKLMGCDQIIVVDTAPMRLEMARAHGATTVINATSAEAKDEILRLTGGKGVDVVYDITGHPSVLPTTFPLVRKLGKVVLLGDAGAPSQQVLSGELLTRGLKLIGIHDSLPPQQRNDYVRWSAMEMYELFMRYLERGQMNFRDLITHRFKPDDASKAYDLLNRERQSVMGVLFEWR